MGTTKLTLRDHRRLFEKIKRIKKFKQKEEKELKPEKELDADFKVSILEKNKRVPNITGEIISQGTSSDNRYKKVKILITRSNDPDLIGTENNFCYFSTDGAWRIISVNLKTGEENHKRIGKKYIITNTKQKAKQHKVAA